MTIHIGEKIPDVILTHMAGDGVKPISTRDLFAGKKTVLFALPGAFTPTCSARHLPGFVENAHAMRKRGVDSIVCLSVNDAYVMAAWARDQNVGATVHMVADGNGDFTKAVGLEEDRRDRGMGMRSQRYAMIVENGVLKVLNVEAPGAFEVSSAESVLALL